MTEQQSPTDNKESITDDTTENIKRLPTKYVEDHSVIPGLTHGYRPFYNWDIMLKSHDFETVEYNGKTYMRSMITPQFPAGTVYQSVDLGAITATNEAVTITCASDEGYVYWTKSGVVCTLSENMENDPYVDMLAVRTVSDSGKEKTELYYIPKARPQAESVYEIFEGNNRYHGSSCLSSDGLKSITVSEYTNSKNIDRDKDVITRKTVTNESAKKIYNMIKNGRIQTNASIADDPTIIELDFQFSDLSGERFSYFPDKSLIGYNNTYYEVPTDLKTEVNSILNNAQINN